MTDDGLDGLFDAAGNQLKFRSGVAPTLAWSWANRLAAVTLVAREGSESDAQYYAYDAAGIRSRKLTRRLVGGTMTSEETITLGDLAIHRKLREGAVVEEWRSARVRDDARCIAELVDWTVGTPPSGVSAQQERYQLDNMIHSSTMEVNGDGAIISYEEYAPFGVTVYAAGTSFAEVSLKSHRYAGHDRDKATGLYYYGARYYAPWLLRWLSPDPAGDIDGINLYAFVGGSPVSHTDIGGYERGRQRTREKRKKKSDSKTTQSKSKQSTPKKVKTSKTSVDPNTSGKITKPRRRAGFKSHANKKKKKGTDLAHRYSYEEIANRVVEGANSATRKQEVMPLLREIAGTDKTLHSQLDTYEKSSTIDQKFSDELISGLNSSEHNLRPGESRPNRRLKQNFDSGVVDSAKRKRARSPSPISKRMMIKTLEGKTKLSVYAPEGDTAMTSTFSDGITIKDIFASLSPLLSGTLVGEQVGNRHEFQLR